MKKSELRNLICERFSQNEFNTLMLDFCEKHPEVNHFENFYGGFEFQVSQLLQSLNDDLLLKLEQYVYISRLGIHNPFDQFGFNATPQKPDLNTKMGVRDAILIKYKEEELCNILFGFYESFDWEINIGLHLSYKTKVDELVRFFSRRSMLPELVERLGL